MHIYHNQKLGLFACLCLIVLAVSVLALAGTITRQTAAAPADSDLQVKAAMLTAALDEVGVCSPKDAALLWAKGLKLRSGALQYAVLSHGLKEQYAKTWEQTAPGWVTGVSSPWVSGYEIVGERHENGVYTYALEFTTQTSTGEQGVYSAKLTEAMEDGFWRITLIKADEALDVYTGAG